MPNKYFKFKQFTVWHDKCAMKIGTDGVLIGAWVNLDNAKRVLDVGTGTGLIALIVAQRCNAKIVGVEIDVNASIQAKENVSISPWADRISIENIDFNNYNSNELFDVIISNPPFFENALKCENNKRSLARHCVSLSYEQLISKSSQLLADNGEFTLIFPHDIKEKIKQIAAKCNLSVLRELDICPNENVCPKRSIVTFGYNGKQYVAEKIVVEIARHQYTKEYIDLTKDFYLNM